MNHTPPYTWDGRFWRDARGRFVARQTVEEALDNLVAGAAQEASVLAGRLREGRISLGKWQSEMLALVKQQHAAAGALAHGGIAFVSPAERGRLGARIRFQLGRLRTFAEQIASGEQPLNGRLDVRARLYVSSAWSSFQNERAVVREEQGFDQYRNILEDSAQHCQGCLDAAAAGWVAIGTLSPIGSRDCQANDKCHFIYRNSGTGEEIDG